VLNYS